VGTPAALPETAPERTAAEALVPPTSTAAALAAPAAKTDRRLIFRLQIVRNISAQYEIFRADMCVKSEGRESLWPCQWAILSQCPQIRVRKA
jgi:hypothetical protein